MSEQKLEVSIAIPDQYVLVTKIEYNELKEKSVMGRYLTLQDLMDLTGKSKPWLNEKLLSHPRRMKDIEPFTHFPQSRGDKWAFKEKEMRDYLDKHFLDILRG